MKCSAGSNRSAGEGNEAAEAFGEACYKIRRQRECAGRNASDRRASLEKDDAQADPTTLSMKADKTERIEQGSIVRRCAGVVATAYTQA